MILENQLYEVVIRSISDDGRSWVYTNLGYNYSYKEVVKLADHVSSSGSRYIPSNMYELRAVVLNFRIDVEIHYGALVIKMQESYHESI